jgi:hypothetical protein
LVDITRSTHHQIPLPDVIELTTSPSRIPEGGKQEMIVTQTINNELQEEDSN